MRVLACEPAQRASRRFACFSDRQVLHRLAASSRACARFEWTTQDSWPEDRVPAARLERFSVSQPLPHRLPTLHVVANDFDGSGDGNREQQSERAPHPSPEKQGDRDRHGVQMDAASDESGQQIIRRHQMKESEYSANYEEWAYA